ncbi:MAG: methyltransferase domain-containing protein [Pirellulaceae bacterium]
MKNVRIELSSLAELKWKDDSLDLAWLVLVLPYLTEPVCVLKEASRVLKGDASIVLLDLLPHERSAYRQEMGHVRLGVSREELTGWLRQPICH